MLKVSQDTEKLTQYESCNILKLSPNQGDTWKRFCSLEIFKYEKIFAWKIAWEKIELFSEIEHTQK